MQNERIKKTKWAPRVVILLAVIICTAGAILYFATYSQRRLESVIINGTVINVEIATSSQQKSRGLCCRDKLAKNHGMLFVYDSPGNHSFWMKDTRIPLDIYWLDSAKKIVHIEKSVQPSSYPESFETKIPSQYVLETNAGFANKHSISVGDIAEFDLR